MGERELELERIRRERAAQLVRGVGDEPLLAVRAPARAGRAWRSSSGPAARSRRRRAARAPAGRARRRVIAATSLADRLDRPEGAPRQPPQQHGQRARRPAGTPIASQRGQRCPRSRPRRRGLRRPRGCRSGPRRGRGDDRGTPGRSRRRRETVDRDRSPAPSRSAGPAGGRPASVARWPRSTPPSGVHDLQRRCPPGRPRTAGSPERPGRQSALEVVGALVSASSTSLAEHAALVTTIADRARRQHDRDDQVASSGDPDADACRPPHLRRLDGPAAREPVAGAPHRLDRLAGRTARRSCGGGSRT